MHAMSSGMRYQDQHGKLAIETLDAPLVALGEKLAHVFFKRAARLFARVFTSACSTTDGEPITFSGSAKTWASGSSCSASQATPEPHLRAERCIGIPIGLLEPQQVYTGKKIGTGAGNKLARADRGRECEEAPARFFLTFSTYSFLPG